MHNLLTKRSALSVLMASAFLISNPVLAATENTAPQWVSDISAGLNFKSGNSERFDSSMAAKTELDRGKDKFSFSYLGIFSESTDADTDESSVTERNHRLKARYDWNYTEQVFFLLPTFEYYTDEFKNIEHQATLGVAAGYKYINQPDFKVDFYAGPSAQWTKYNEVEMDEDDSETSPVLNLGANVKYDIAENIKYFLDYDVKFVSEDSGKRIHHLETGFKVALVGNLALDAKLIIDRVDDPLPDGDGEIPDEQDNLVIVGLNYSF